MRAQTPSHSVLNSTCCGFRAPRRRGERSRTTRRQIVVRACFVCFVAFNCFVYFYPIRNNKATTACSSHQATQEILVHHQAPVFCSFFRFIFNTTRCRCRFSMCPTKYHTDPDQICHLPLLTNIPADKHGRRQDRKQRKTESSVQSINGFRISLNSALARRTDSNRVLSTFHFFT